MRKFNSNPFMIIFVLVCFIVFLQGCTKNKVFVKKDLITLSPLKMVRVKSSIEKKTLGGFFESTFFCGCCLGCLGGFLFPMILDSCAQGVRMDAGEEVIKKCDLQDYGQIVMNQFVERVSNEIPNWPEMTIEDKPVKWNYVYESGYLLIVRFTHIRLTSYGKLKGLSTTTSIHMKSPDGNLLDGHTFIYDPSEFDRNRDLEELEENNCELLKEDFKFAAEKTVSDFIEYFKGGQTE